MALFPATEDQLVEAGYVLDPRLANCSSCRATVRWCTTPAKRKMPLTVVTQDQPRVTKVLYQTHFADCPQGAAWSNKRKTR